MIQTGLWSHIREQTDSGDSAVTPAAWEIDLHPPCPYLFAVVCDGGEDGAEGFEPHGDVQQMSGKEEVVVMAQDGHGGVPHQIQERLVRKQDENPSAQ